MPSSGVSLGDLSKQSKICFYRIIRVSESFASQQLVGQSLSMNSYNACTPRSRVRRNAHGQASTSCECVLTRMISNHIRSTLSTISAVILEAPLTLCKLHL